jgi:hypothetical protein
VEFLGDWRLARDLDSLGVIEWIQETLAHFASQNDVNEKLLGVLVVFVEAADVQGRL